MFPTTCKSQHCCVPTVFFMRERDGCCSGAKWIPPSVATKTLPLGSSITRRVLAVGSPSWVMISGSWGWVCANAAMINQCHRKLATPFFQFWKGRFVFHFLGIIDCFCMWRFGQRAPGMSGVRGRNDWAKMVIKLLMFWK